MDNLTPFEAKGKPLTTPRLNEDGSVTKTHMLGCDDPQAARLVEIYKGTEDLLPGRYRRSASRPTYWWRVDGGPLKHYGTGVAALRQLVRRNFPNAKTVEH